MKQKTLLSFLSLPLCILFITLAVPVSTIAQGDNPLIDALPWEWRQNINYTESEFDVITVNGFDDFNLGVDFAEPHVTQNPNNPLQYFGAYNINGAWRTSNGHDWIHSSPNFGTSPAGDPVTAYDGNGNLYYETMYGSISGCKVIRSTDNGATWTTAVTSIVGVDKNWMAADQTTGPYSGYVYTTMTSSTGGNFARTTDLGATWTNTATFATQSLPGMMVCIGPNGAIDGGCVYVVTNSGSAFASTYTFYVSTNGGTSFTIKSSQNFSNYVGTNVNGRNSVENMRTRPYPFITADQSNGTYRGRLYLVYASNDPPGNGNKPDIFCRYSDDQGATWSAAVKVNDDPNTQNNHQWHPSIWCDTQTGRLFAKWMDTREDFVGADDSAHIFASYSDDGGVTWAPNQRVSNQKMKIDCATCGGGGTPRYQGDYDAIISYNNQALAMWTDFRSGNFGSFVGYFPDFAMTVSPTSVIISQNGGTEFVTVEVPDVKLYSKDAIFSATVSPTPANGTITLDFPNGNVLSSFPGSVQLRIQTSGDVTLGAYTITIQGNGPDAIPVHRRTVTLDVIIPVELASFSAVTDKNDVILSWYTATETNNQGFEIERKSFGEYKKIGFVEGKGTTTETQYYLFRDKEVNEGVHYYRLKQIDFDGSFKYTAEIRVEISQPVDYFLSQNYPNPFNPTTIINYSIPQDGNVILKIFDVIGNEVSTLVNKYQQAGSFDVVFDGTGLSSGVYYYQLKAGEFTATKKLILTK